MYMDRNYVKQRLNQKLIISLFLRTVYYVHVHLVVYNFCYIRVMLTAVVVVCFRMLMLRLLMPLRMEGRREVEMVELNQGVNHSFESTSLVRRSLYLEQ